MNKTSTKFHCCGLQFNQILQADFYICEIIKNADSMKVIFMQSDTTSEKVR